MTGLGIIASVNMAIDVLYYVRAIAEMYFETPARRALLAGVSAMLPVSRSVSPGSCFWASRYAPRCLSVASGSCCGNHAAHLIL
jgi:hypothetical protein